MKGETYMQGIVKEGCEDRKRKEEKRRMGSKEQGREEF